MSDIGTFRWRPAADHWVWNDAMFRLHGYPPRTVTPSRALLLAHKHPQDRDGAADLIAALAVAHTPFCVRHRIVDAEGRTREVVGAGRVPTPRDRDVELRGFLIPVGAPGAPPPVIGRIERVEIISESRRADERTAAPAIPPLLPDEAAAAADARHAELLRRAHDTLVAGLDVDRETAASILSWLANAHEVPPVMVADGIAALPRDPATGRPDLGELLAALDTGAD